MKIIAGNQTIEVDRLFEGVGFDDDTQQERVIVEVYTVTPLTQTQIAALVENEWECEDGRNHDGMTRVLDTCTRFMQMSHKKTQAEKTLEQENVRLMQERTAVSADIESILQAARDGLLSPPVPGEAWDANKWYRAGDTVTWPDKRAYRCQKTCKGKEPGAGDGYWEPAPDTAPDILIWADIASGAAIEAGTLVKHNDAVWRCKKAHTKSQVRQPSKVQVDYWEVYDDDKT